MIPLAPAHLDALDARAARVAALDALARRDHASAALRRKLRDKGYDAAVVGEVVERLLADKLVDDHRYVENFVSSRAGRGQGPRRVGADLRKAGLDDGLIEQALGGFGGWNAEARKACQKKFGGQSPTDYAARRRQARFLSQRGFTGAQIRTALGFDTDIDADFPSHET